ncbi:cell division protein ZapA [Vagococcus vulneris]|nr:cell division protein ZapA [Vagococcus vulneris]
MTEEKIRYKASIAGKNYTIIGKESHAHMDLVSELANEQLAAIKESAPSISAEQASVLLAINTLSVQVKLQEKIIQLEDEIKRLKTEAANAEDLESRLDELQKNEKELRKNLSNEKRELSKEEMQHQIEVQKLLNQQVKEKIQKNNHKKLQNHGKK